ncbi:PBPRA1643 family SWIM/SEC-C metal-binding motif protein [Shewanella sp.]|uniref:PBPRA1643 family SWIM/SEC-C metal-binding motif protein n=1 Tax=Shewanella sp. TaxID=50422 RepID=UPI004053AA78
MSDKFFFKGRKTPKPAYGESGYNTKRLAKLGTKEHPLVLSVQTQTRLDEVNALLAERQLIASVTLDTDKAEDIVQLMGIINKPKTVSFDAKPNRNEACQCGSGAKYKKCCGA